MALRKTNEEWVNEVHHVVGNDYVFLEHYINSTTKILVKHNKCNHIYKVQPKAFLSGNRCPNCNTARKLTTAEFTVKMSNLPKGGEYTLVSEYEGHHKKITVTHKICGNTYSVLASDFIKGRRCVSCLRASNTKTQEQWEKQVSTLSGDEYTFLEPYVMDNVKISYRHNTCGTEHKVTPNNFINGTRCPRCKDSKGEAHIRKFLTDNNIEFIQQKKFNDLQVVKQLSYDFYLPELNILIEFQGEQHYKPIDFFGGSDKFKCQQEHDKLKRDYAKHNGIGFIEVKYTKDTYKKVANYLAPAMAKAVNKS
ncbi:hypothetical protein PHIM1EF22_0060 [Enterococcus phage phiM1EF22]|nr:hypothetical protein PHIM1EF22_0060 [Enterococcus phage phiM1EF22]